MELDNVNIVVELFPGGPCLGKMFFYNVYVGNNLYKKFFSGEELLAFLKERSVCVGGHAFPFLQE